MTKIVGIDFGTTNVRVAEWDTTAGRDASSSQIGSGEPWMPAVLSFHRSPIGDVEIKVGEDADIEDDGPDVEVVRNVKRWALVSDEYVREQLKRSAHQGDISCPKWLNSDTRSIQLWNETLPIEEALKMIIKEAISRAGLTGVKAEWRAGCPVGSDLTYRKALASALEELDCTGRIEWITEEPLLFLSFADRIASLPDGSYLVYDLGGGSFDCAVVSKEGQELTVYSEEGLPALGGMDIDDRLSQRLGYGGKARILRIAKETLSDDAEPVQLVGGKTLTQQDVDAVLEDGKYIEKTLDAMLRAYRKAKLLWQRPAGSPPYGESLGSGTVWSLGIEDMTRDIDRVLVVGGPTRIPYIRNGLRDIFGAQKVVLAEDLVLAAGRAGIGDASLTALSHGACYMYGKQYMPVTVDRVPANITLRVRHGASTLEDRYEAFQCLPEEPLAPYNGDLLDADHHKAPWSNVDPNEDKLYSVSIESPDGDALYPSGNEPTWREMRMPRETHTGPRADRIRLIVDRLGSVWVELGAGFTHVPRPLKDIVPIVEYPVWQTATQKRVMQRLHEEQRKHEKEEADRLHHTLTHNPFGHGVRPG